ncbi:MAG: efflux RND transporter periplasmic adaptor subunit [Bacteroidetes bacterium]|jgi:RND family efflux transporter MFP subunit|nr:efflux RND transporter periplasmic adaptor subunit [Bacteroidota bacterium]
MKSYLIGAGILLGGGLIAFLLIALAPEPPREPPPTQVPLVSTTAATAERGSLRVQGNGTVRPAREIDLNAEVAGRIVSASEALESGGRFQAGETLVQIDPSDYEAAVQQAQAAVTEAQFQVIQAREEAQSARAEYERLRRSTGQTPGPDSTELGRLVYREPQLRRAQANLESARAALQTARTNLRRTTVEAPFNGQVRTKRADLGAYVTPGTPIATIHGTDAVEVPISLTSREAALVEGLWAAQAERRSNIPATVTAEYGGERFAWDGTVDRVEGAIDAQTRTIDVVVHVPRPYDPNGMRVTTQPPEQPMPVERPPLQVGQYTTVNIRGRAEADYLTVPRRAVRTREPGRPAVVWTVVGDTMLVERDVQVIQTVEETSYLAPTFAGGTPVITSDLRVHTDSMRVRVAR